MDDDEEWLADEDVPPTLKAKILAIKICRNRSLVHASSDKALEISTPVMKMLATLLEHNGSFTGQDAEEYVLLNVTLTIMLNINCVVPK